MKNTVDLPKLRRAPLSTLIAPIASQLESVRTELRDIIVSGLADFPSTTHFGDFENADDCPLMPRGKMLRPALVLLSAKSCRPLGEDNLDSATERRLFDTAVAVEALHTASLWHDDVLDCSVLRRGQASAPALLGNRRAVLQGDWLVAHVFMNLVSHADLTLLSELAETLSKMSKAQVIEEINRGNSKVSIGEYIDIVSGKTASLLSSCCRAGALISNGNSEQALALQRYGYNIGIAFQICDDILDIWGDPKSMGKSNLGDWNEQNLTLPIILARDSASPELREHLLSLLSSHVKEAECQIPRILLELGALTKTLEYANKYVRAAQEELTALPSGNCRTILHNIAEWCSNLEEVEPSLP